MHATSNLIGQKAYLSYHNVTRMWPIMGFSQISHAVCDISVKQSLWEIWFLSDCLKTKFFFYTDKEIFTSWRFRYQSGRSLDPTTSDLLLVHLIIPKNIYDTRHWETSNGGYKCATIKSHIWLILLSSTGSYFLYNCPGQDQNFVLLSYSM